MSSIDGGEETDFDELLSSLLPVSEMA